MDRHVDSLRGDPDGELSVGSTPVDRLTSAQAEPHISSGSVMASDFAPRVDSSPEVLCVSDSRRSTRHIRETVAGYRPAETIETTTDPTVVPELVAVWRLDCIVVEDDIQPVDGFELRSSLRRIDPQLSVVVVSIDPTAEETVAVVTAGAPETEDLSACLDQAHRSSAETTVLDHSGGRLDRLTDAGCPRELKTELDSLLAVLPAVVSHRIWIVGLDDFGEPTRTGDTNCLDLPPLAREAIESGEPQYAADPTDSSTNRSIDTQTVAYPLGDQGVFIVELRTLTPAVAARLDRLTTVAAACLEHQTAVTLLEGRFRQTAEHNRQLSQFARTVAHDLNSPLSVIYGRIELALADQSAAEIHLQAARNAAKRVDSLVTDHLQRIETTDDGTNREEVSVQTMAIQAWRIIDPSTARLQVEPQLETVEANAIRLQQLFENLIRNAIEHGSEESVGLGSTDSQDPHAVFDDDTDSVTVTIKPTDSGFAVCDDGPGIPPADRETVFESGYTTTESGSGLGLDIVSEIVASHDWEISVTESASGGARFEVDTE